MDPLIQALVDAGFLTLADARALSAILSPEVARAEAEAAVEAAFAAGLNEQQARLLGLLRRTNYAPSARQLDAFWAQEATLFWSRVSPTILDEMAQSVALSVMGVAELDLWEAVAEDALNFARTYYLSADPASVGSLPNLNLTSRTQFERQFSLWLEGNLPSQQGRDAMGMRAGQGIEDLIVALEPTFGPTRAEAIGVTETTRIFTEARRAAERSNDLIVGYRLLTSADDRVCSICGPLYGQVRRKDVLYYVHPELGQLYGPPFHTRCRCDEASETAESLQAEW